MADTHKIRFEPVDIEMDVDEDETILDAAFRQGIHLMHGCREGQCSACKSFVLDGEVQMDRWSTFACNEAEADEGYVLLCRAHAYDDCTIELLNFDEDELLGGIALQQVRTRVEAVQELTHDIVLLRLAAVDPPTFEFHPGQYADLTIPGTEAHRSFSMATTPSTPGTVEFIVKRYAGGRFSALLDPTAEGALVVGDELAMTGPYGSFTLKEGHVLPVVCIGGGAGMAPILSLLRHLVETGSTRPVRFYYGARTAEDLFHLDEIVELGKRLTDFVFVACLSAVVEPDHDAVSFRPGVELELGMVTDVVDRREDQVARCEVYLCGPPPMVDAALELLAVREVPLDQVFFDKFTSPALP